MQIGGVMGTAEDGSSQITPFRSWLWAAFRLIYSNVACRHFRRCAQIVLDGEQVNNMPIGICAVAVRAGGAAGAEYWIVRQLPQANKVIRYRVRSSADERDEMMGGDPGLW